MKTKMKAMLVSLALPAFALAGTDSILTVPEINLGDVEFVAVEPIACPYVTLPTSTGNINKYFSEIPSEEVNRLLPLEQSFVSIRKVEQNGGLGFATAKLSGEKGTYKVFLDYIKYRDETTVDSKQRVRVGVGIRIVADITTAKANLDLGSIFAIGLAYKAGYVNGRVQVLKIGVDSDKISALMPPPSDLSDTALQNALQSAATVHAMLYDSKTVLTPFIIAVGKVKVGPNPDK